MISRVVAAVLLVVGLGVAAPTAPSHAGGPAPTFVTVAEMQFTPATVRVAMIGYPVYWEFQDAVVHTATSDQGFWDSGPHSSGGMFSWTFKSAGTFGYHCTFHPHMTGKVQVPVNATGSPTAGWDLRWTTTGIEGQTYDVQVRKGKKAWQTLRKGTASQRAGFDRVGTWSVRARTWNGSGHSGWSPVVKVTSR